MRPPYDWKPSIKKYPSGEHSCHILRKVWTNGGYLDDTSAMTTNHYDHPSPEAAEACAWLQIKQLREDQGGWIPEETGGGES
jgi:hypothetical protein